jgi:hypothetical protein
MALSVLFKIPKLGTMNVWFGRELTSERTPMRFERYEVGGFFDKFFGENRQARASSPELVNNIENLPEGELVNWQ